MKLRTKQLGKQFVVACLIAAVYWFIYNSRYYKEYDKLIVIIFLLIVFIYGNWVLSPDFKLRKKGAK